MRSRVAPALLLLLAACGHPEPPPRNAVPDLGSPLDPVPGSIRGLVTCSGPVPKLRIADLDLPWVRAMDAGLEAALLDPGVGPGGELANVFVYVKAGAPPSTPPQVPAELAIQGALFEPRVLGVVAGQRVVVTNGDRCMHWIHVVPEKNQERNRELRHREGRTEFQFPVPELGIQVKCDVHGWMRATIHVVESAFFAVTDRQGRYEIKGLPEGPYQVEAVHAKFGRLESAVLLPPGGGILDFAFKRD